MCESVEIPGPGHAENQKTKKFRPEETPVDVISRALEVLEDDDYIDEETKSCNN